MRKSRILHLAWLQALDNHMDLLQQWERREVPKTAVHEAWAEFKEIDGLLDQARREEWEELNHEN